MAKIKMIILFTLLIVPILYSQTDSLVFNESEHMIGEIKYMKLGVIQIETSYSDNDFQINWSDVKEIFSERNYIITITDGKRIIGTINTDPSNVVNVIIITKENGSGLSDNLDNDDTFDESNKMTFKKMEIVNIKPLDTGFWDQLTASVDVGFTYTKANNVKQFSIRSYIGYMTDNWIADLSYDEVKNSQDSVKTTTRTDIKGSYVYFTGKRWFVMAAIGFLQNDEQKLLLRSTPMLGIGNYIIQNNSLYLGLHAGTSWNTEKYTDPTLENRSTAETYIGIEYNMFDFGDISLLTNIFAYKSLNEADRFRTDFKFDLQYDLPYDFYVKLGYTLNYDSVPVEGASESDYVLQTTFGWEL